jgi:site-specific DNA-methyltransferase (adenine-specific)
LDFDPCPLANPSEVGMPLFGTDALAKPWRDKRVFCNPPYGPGIDYWLAKAREATIAVFLVPSRTDTRWWHRYAMRADEIRFLRGRLKFGGAKNSAPFPSVVLVFRNERADARWTGDASIGAG